MVRTLQVAVSGLGRMGARHALHFLEKTPRASLVAVCDPDPQARAWATANLAPYGTKIYSDFDEMLAHPGLEAVCIAGITTEHAPQTLRAIAADKHVLCEKPLSVDIATCEAVVPGLFSQSLQLHLWVSCTHQACPFPLSTPVPVSV